MNTEELDLLMKLIDKVGNKSDSIKVNPAMQAKAEKTAKHLNQQTERIIQLEKDVDELLKWKAKFVSKQEDTNRKLKYEIANVPKIKPVDTFNNSDDHREMLEKLEDLKSSDYRYYQDIKLIKEWIKATKFPQKEKIRCEIVDDLDNGVDEDDDKREVSLSDVIVSPDIHKELVNRVMTLDTRTTTLMDDLEIETLEDLMCYTQKELLSNDNFGGCSMAKLNKDLKGLGISLSKGD